MAEKKALAASSGKWGFVAIRFLFALLGVFFFSTPTLVQADYRVFLLRITKIKKPASPKDSNAVDDANTKEEATFREELSTLDPQQYRGYFPVAADEVVTYTATWRCHGRTNGQDLCPNPKAVAEKPQDPPQTPW